MANNRRKPNTKGKGKFQDKDRFEKDDRSTDRNKYGSSKNQKKGNRSSDSPSNYSNDPGWWNRAGNLTQLATNISTEIPIGIQLDTDMLQHWTPSGVLKLEYAPCFGDIDSPTHPFNVIARSLYDFINSRNSRSSQYDPSDLILYIIAVANAWSLHAWIRRIVGMYNTFSPMNRYWWDSVLATMGVAPISQTDDIDNWVSVANRIALTLNTLAVPRDIKYFDRTQMLTSAVYADSPTSKASLYYYQPAALFKYGYDEEGKGMLSLSRTPFAENTGTSPDIDRNITPQRIWTYFEDLIANLLNDTDISYMKADIRKAYDDNVYTIPQIDNTFSLGAVFDGFINLQTRNATVHSYLKEAMYTSMYKVTQNMGTNSLTSTRVGDMISAHESAKKIPSIAHSYGNGNKNLPHLFDFPVDEVTNDLVTEATKLHAFISPGDKFRATCEVIIWDCFYTFEYNWDTETTTLVKTSDITTLGYDNSAPVPAEQVNKMMHGLELASKYAASPLQFVVYNDSSYFYPMEGSYIVEDLTNYTTIDAEQLQNIWDAAQMSILAPFDMK